MHVECDIPAALCNLVRPLVISSKQDLMVTWCLLGRQVFWSSGCILRGQAGTGVQFQKCCSLPTSSPLDRADGLDKLCGPESRGGTQQLNWVGFWITGWEHGGGQITNRLSPGGASWKRIVLAFCPPQVLGSRSSSSWQPPNICHWKCDTLMTRAKQSNMWDRKW